MEIKKDDKSTIKAWTFYDWANSAFPLVINSAIFPAFYEYQTSHNTQGELINSDIVIGSLTFKNTEFYSYIVSISLLIVCFGINLPFWASKNEILYLYLIF